MLGTERRPLTLADVGLTIGLTGAKSYHGFLPTLHTGAGIVSNFSSADPGGYRFGTRFALAFGGGLRYQPRRPLDACVATSARTCTRSDIRTRTSRPGSTAPPSCRPTSRKSNWTNNLGATIGVSYHFLR